MRTFRFLLLLAGLVAVLAACSSTPAKPAGAVAKPVATSAAPTPESAQMITDMSTVGTYELKSPDGAVVNVTFSLGSVMPVTGQMVGNHGLLLGGNCQPTNQDEAVPFRVQAKVQGDVPFTDSVSWYVASPGAGLDASIQIEWISLQPQVTQPCTPGGILDPDLISMPLANGSSATVDGWVILKGAQPDIAKAVLDSALFLPANPVDGNPDPMQVTPGDGVYPQKDGGGNFPYGIPLNRSGDGGCFVSGGCSM